MGPRVQAEVFLVVLLEVDPSLQREVGPEVVPGVVPVVTHGADLAALQEVVQRVDLQAEEVRCTVGQEVVLAEVVLVARHAVGQAAEPVAGRQALRVVVGVQHRLQATTLHVVPRSQNDKNGMSLHLVQMLNSQRMLRICLEMLTTSAPCQATEVETVLTPT